MPRLYCPDGGCINDTSTLSLQKQIDCCVVSYHGCSQGEETVGATVKAGTQERGTERGTEVRCKVHRK